MGKVSKRQRKFLSKNVLAHRKKGGLRRTTDGKDKQAARSGTASAPETQPPAATRKTLPDGIDTEAFLECPWLTQEACAAAPADNTVPIFRLEETVLESRPEKSASGSHKRFKVRGSSPSSSLSAEAAQAMVERAMDGSSIDDLLLVVRALQISCGRIPEGVPPPSAAEGELRAEPGSSAWDALRREGFGRLHAAFLAHLGPDKENGNSPEEWEEAVHVHRQKFAKAEAWPRLGSALLAFLTIALDTLGTSETTSTSGSRSEGGAQKSCALVEGLVRMRNHVPLLFPFPRLARRYLCYLLGVLETVDDRAAVSLAFVRLYELSTSQPMPFLHDAFKGAYRIYRAAAERIGAGTSAGAVGEGAGVLGKGTNGDGSLPLLRECFAELFGVEKPSAYLHAYVYIHELVREALAAAAEANKLGGDPKKTGPALRRLRSWGFVQCLQLWTCVVAAHPGKAYLGPLVPPLAKALEVSFQLSPGLHGAPRILALARSAQDLAAAAGVFLPTSHHLVELLELLHPHEGRPCPPFGGKYSGKPGGGHGGESDEEELKDYKPLRGENRKSDGSDGDGKKRHRTHTETENGKDGVGMVDLSAVAGLGKEDLRSGEVHAAVSRAAAGLIVRETVCYRWNAGLPELCAGTQARLEKLLEGSRLPVDGGARRCRARVKSVHAAVGRAAVETAARRGQGNKHPGEAGPINTFRGMEESTASQCLQLFKEPY